MDHIDRAAEYEERERLAAIARRLKTPKLIGTSHCVDCGEKICPARKKANPGACRCIECQHYLEKETRHAKH